MAKGVCELLWIRNLMQDLGIELSSPMRLYCDNKAACDIAHNPVQHDRTKYVEVDRHFIKEKLEALKFPMFDLKTSLQMYSLRQFQVKHFIAILTSWA